LNFLTPLASLKREFQGKIKFNFADELPQIPNDEAGLTLSTLKKYISRSFGDISV
jgi:hypothetical protein